MPITSVSAEPLPGRVRPEIALVSSLGEHLVGNYVLVRDVLAPLVVGADAFDSEWVSRRIERAAFGNSFARAAVESALIDLQGHLANVPAYKLLGGCPADRLAAGVRLKFVVGAVEPVIAASRAHQMTSRGWGAIKVKVGRDREADVERLTAVRDAIGPDTFLSVDANGGYSVADAIWAARKFESLGVALFEQPTRRGDHRAMAEVRARSGIPVMADESVFTLADAMDVLRHRAADVLSLYPGKHGGIRNTQAIARAAEAEGVACTIGSNLEREPATAAMAHLALATPNIDCERYPGDLIGPVYFEEPFAKGLRYAADRVFVGDGLGLGVS